MTHHESGTISQLFSPAQGIWLVCFHQDANLEFDIFLWTAKNLVAVFIIITEYRSMEACLIVG
jgi:hypothetical protein